MPNWDVAILAGGAGVGLGPISQILPKAAYPIGKQPLMALQLLAIQRSFGDASPFQLHAIYPATHPRLVTTINDCVPSLDINWIRQDESAQAGVALQRLCELGSDRPLLAMVGDAYFSGETISRIIKEGLGNSGATVGTSIRDAADVGPIALITSNETGSNLRFGAPTSPGLAQVDGGIWVISAGARRTITPSVASGSPDRIVRLWNHLLDRGYAVSPFPLSEDLHIGASGAGADRHMLNVAKRILQRHEESLRRSTS